MAVVRRLFQHDHKCVHNMLRIQMDSRPPTPVRRPIRQIDGSPQRMRRCFNESDCNENFPIFVNFSEGCREIQRAEECPADKPISRKQDSGKIRFPINAYAAWEWRKPKTHYTYSVPPRCRAINETDCSTKERF